MKCIPVFFAVAASFILLSAYKENNANRHPSRPNSKPNIIFILTDDQRWDALGFAGNPIIKTPNIDGLARGGIYFKNAFASTPICAASRASLFTGLYERTHDYTFGKLPLSNEYMLESYPYLLRKAGYKTGFVGKFGVKVNKGIESPDRYILQIFWATLEDHTIGFRQSPAFADWRAIVGPFFASPPVVEHFELVCKSD